MFRSRRAGQAPLSADEVRAAALTQEAAEQVHRQATAQANAQKLRPHIDKLLRTPYSTSPNDLHKLSHYVKLHRGRDVKHTHVRRTRDGVDIRTFHQIWASLIAEALRGIYTDYGYGVSTAPDKTKKSYGKWQPTLIKITAQ